MKFRSLVALTALALFLLVFFLGLSSGTEITTPSQNSVMYKLFNGTVLVLNSSREAMYTLVMQVQEALNLSVIGVNKTTQLVKETINQPEKQAPDPFKPPPDIEETGEVSQEASQDQEELPLQTENANAELTNNELTVLLYNGKNLSKQSVFEEQMQYLAANNYQTLTVPEIDGYNPENKAKPVALTFDLGFKDFYQQVFPVLQKHSLKATIFVPDNYQPEAAEELVIDAFLSKGSSGTKTKQLQQNLNNFGYRLLADGLFGAFTMAKVVDFQRTNSLLVDGIVGPQTAGQINKLVNELKAIQNSELVIIMNRKPELANVQELPENYPLEEFSSLLKGSSAQEKN